MNSSNIQGAGYFVSAPIGTEKRARVAPRDLLALTKPRVTTMVLATGGAGAAMAPGAVSNSALALSLIGTVLIVSAANALNMWWERDVDALMSRTRNRPLPAGRMQPEVALVFGLALAAISVPMLFAVNITVGLLGLVALVTYVAIYTPLKKYTPLALQVGAVPGAIPPLIGWATVTGELDRGGLALFALMFFWQVPHFIAITVFRAEEYARAGLKVHAVARGLQASRTAMIFWTVALLGSTFLPFFFLIAGTRYLLVALISGALFIFLGLRGYAAENAKRWSRGVFGYSIVYLVVLFGAMLADRREVEVVTFGRVPEFHLTDQYNRETTRLHFANHVTVVDFFFTNCQQSCPRLTRIMGDLRGRFSSDPHVQFASISVDPETDTPELLRAYAERSNANAANWAFLTGPSIDVQSVVVQGFKMTMDKGAVGADGIFDVMHGNRFVVIDENGEIRGYYGVDTEAEIQTLEHDIKQISRRIR